MRVRAGGLRGFSAAHIGEPRERLRRAFGEFRQHLTECRRDPDYRFAVSDVDAFRAFLWAHCEERPFVRELVAATRVTLALGYGAGPRDPVLAEWQRRKVMQASAYWEGVLGGVVEEEAIGVGPPVPAVCITSATEEQQATIRAGTEAVLRAEKAATLAALVGARYPEHALDKAWRQVLTMPCGAAEEGEASGLDLLAEYREAWELAAEVTDRALVYLARAVNTAAARGAAQAGGSLVVLNLTGRREVTVCHARIELSGALRSGFQVRDARGQEVSYQLVSASRMGEANWVEVSFRAADLPCVGYTTYSLLATNRFPEPASLSEVTPARSSVVAQQVPVQAGPLPAELDLVSVDSPNISIVAVKPAAAPGLLVRVHECEGRPVSAVAAFGGGLERAWRMDPREREIGDLPAPRFGWRRAPRVSLSLGAFESANLAVALKPLPRAGDAVEIGPTTEPYGPIYCRYWEHNLRAAPLGDLPLGVWTNGVLLSGQNVRFPLSLSNDSRDREFAGAVRVLAPENWMVIPRQVPYRVAPGSQALYEIAATVPEDAPPCFLRFETEDGERTIQDVLSVGEIRPLEVSLTRDDSSFAVRVTNPNPDYVEGQVALITPLETWGAAAGGHTRARVTPRGHPFLIAAQGEDTLRFAVEGDLSAVWAVAKVMWYGHVQYVREAD